MDAKQRDVLIALIIVFITASFIIFLTWPFKEVIVVSFFLAYLLHYPQRWLARRTGRPKLSALAVLLAMWGSLMAILLSVVFIVYNEFTKLSASQNIDMLLSGGGLNSIVNRISHRISQSVPLASLQDRLTDIISSLLQGGVRIAIDALSRTIPSIPTYVVELIITTLIAYFLLLTGERALTEFTTLVPTAYEKLVHVFLDNIKGIYYTVYVVQISVSLFSGLLAIIGYGLLGVPYFVTFGILIGIFGLIPVIGRAIIYVPLTVYFFLIGEPLRAILLLVFSWAVLDQLTGLYIIPQLSYLRAKVPQIITLLAFTAPVLAIGPLGIIIGPAIFGFALALYRTYRDITISGPKNVSA
jgi:predicted PurR-regulated permease PerM